MKKLNLILMILSFIIVLLGVIVLAKAINEKDFMVGLFGAIVSIFWFIKGSEHYKEIKNTQK